MYAQESHLVAEIEFWRELIDSQTRNRSATALERMRQALALAERKLLLLELDLTVSEDGTTGSRSRKEH